MSFLDFNYTNGALNLFEQTIRNAVDFNAMEDDVFEARVLTTPTRITNNIASIGSSPLSSNDSNIKHSFRVRILGPLSAHNFIEDPCGLDKFSDERSKEIGFSILQNHTEVIIDDEWASPSMGDVVIIKLERTTKKNNKRGFNYKNAKQYLGVARKSPLPESSTTQQLCDKLAEIFENADLSSLAKFSSNAPARKSMYRNEPVENGRIQGKFLVKPVEYASEKGMDLTGVPSHDHRGRPIYFIEEIMHSFIKLCNDYHKHFKEPISISNAYRDYEWQTRLRAQYGRGAAAPGTSNHGWGVAFDVNGTNRDMDGDGVVGKRTDRFVTPVYLWLDNGGQGRHGFVNPPSLRQNGSLPESWHWENTTVRDQVYSDLDPDIKNGTPDGTEVPPEEAVSTLLPESPTEETS